MRPNTSEMNPSPEKRIVFDVDGVVCRKEDDLDYSERQPHEAVVESLRSYYERGYYIILYTARNMNTHEGRLGRINADTAKTLLDWLDEHEIPYDEIHYAKPWCGHHGFYVDDKAIRPTELLNNSDQEIRKLLEDEEQALQR